MFQTYLKYQSLFAMLPNWQMTAPVKEDKLFAREKKILCLKAALLHTYEIQANNNDDMEMDDSMAQSPFGWNSLGQEDYAKNRQNMEKLLAVLASVPSGDGTLLDEFVQELSAFNGDFCAFRIQLGNQIKECREGEHAQLMRSLSGVSMEEEEQDAPFNKDTALWDGVAAEMVNNECRKPQYANTICVLKHLLARCANADSEKRYYQLQCLLEQTIQTLETEQSRMEDEVQPMDRGQWQCLIVSIMGSIVALYNQHDGMMEKEDKYRFLCVKKKYQTLHSEMDAANKEDYPKLYCQGLQFCVNYLYASLKEETSFYDCCSY